METDVLIIGAGLSGLVAAAEATAAGHRVVVVDQEPGAESGRAGRMVVRRPLPRGHARAAAPRRARQSRLGVAGLGGHGRLRPRGRQMAAALGRGICQLGGGRKEVVAARARRPLLPGRRVGRARRLHRDRPGQLGPALPHRLGHRPGHRTAVRRGVSGCRGARTTRVPLPAPRDRVGHCRTAPSSGRAASASRRAMWSAARPPAAASRASSRSRPAPLSSRRAASGRTWIWCGKTGPRAWGRRRTR